MVKTENKVKTVADKYNQKAEAKAEKVTRKVMRSTGQKIKWFIIKFVIILLAAAILLSAITGALVYFNVVEIPFVSNIFYSFGITNNYGEISVYEYLNYNIV